MKSIPWIIALKVLIAGCAIAGAVAVGTIFASKTPAATEVKIDNFSFAPQTVTVQAGTAVHWTNRDDIPHTVVSEDKSFKSKVMDTDEDFTYTFTKPGTYSYFCSLHPKMTAKVVVH